jgi:hypothetical protein
VVYNNNHGFLLLSNIPGLEIINNIIAFNSVDGAQSVTAQPTAIITYNDSYGNGNSAWAGINPGVGCIYLNPQFTNNGLSNYALSATSPCINSGDPTIIDPDGTRSDMGALYYNMVLTGNVTIELTPENTPIIIPVTGGIVNFNVLIPNDSVGTALFDGWIMLTLPNGLIYGPTLLRQGLMLAPNQQIDRDLSMNIPMFAMSGEYIVTGYVGDYPDSAIDSSSFNFTKSATDSRIAGKFESWSISGWDDSENFNPPAYVPETYGLKLTATPNPFNPKTTLKFFLVNANQIELRIFDVKGCEIAELLKGYYSPGNYEVTFNGDNLPSGVYFSRLQIGNNSCIQKLLLIK